MAKEKKSQRAEFKGHIEHISVSPHGDPEGIVLEDGTFIKIPPHSLVAKDEIRKGVVVQGSGERVDQNGNRTFHRVQLKVGKKIISDNTLDPKTNEELKEKHKRANKEKPEIRSEKIIFEGKVVAFGSKPKGEIDRILFADGTSVHVPKDIDLESEDIAVGNELRIEGESRVFGDLRFVKAKSVVAQT